MPTLKVFRTPVDCFKRRFLWWMNVGLVFVVASIYIWKSTATAWHPCCLKVGVVAGSLGDMAITVAEINGLLREGLHGQYKVFRIKSTDLLSNALSEGSVDVAYGISAAIVITRHTPSVRIVGAVVNKPLTTILTHRGAKLTTVADLKGKKVAISGYWGHQEFIKGIPGWKDLQPVKSEGTLQALQQRRVDAAVVIFSPQTLRGNFVLDGAWRYSPVELSLAVAINQKNIPERRMIEDFVAMMVKAHQTLYEISADKFAGMIKEGTQYPENDGRLLFKYLVGEKLLSSDLRTNSDAIGRLTSKMTSSGILRVAPKTEEIVDLSFLPTR